LPSLDRSARRPKHVRHISRTHWRAKAYRFAAGLAVALGVADPALAEDPPTRVGSLNYVSGEVSYALRGERGEPDAAAALSWIQADFDQPVSEDMSLRTGRLARARIRVGSNAIELADDTVLNMLNLTDRLIEASVARGRVYLQVNRLGADESVEIEIPRGSLWLLQPGGYDIEVGNADQPARVTVFEGKARFVGGAADTAVAAGRAVQIAGTYPAVTATEHPAAAMPAPAGSDAGGSPPGAAAGSGAAPADAVKPVASAERGSENDGHPAAAQAAADQPRPAVAAAETAQQPADDFLFWVAESKNRPQADQSARHVSAQTTGYDELDRYGQWQDLPGSGAVWFPSSVPANWAPYRYGHWTSIAPWGWTWVDDAPWGFAPSHYGRWVNLDGRWGWVPGPVQTDPVYAPALVAFVDPNAGPDAAGAAGGPDVGWFPLGPADGFLPWYVAGPAYVERVNVAVSERSVVAGRAVEAWQGHFANRQFATVVPRGVFAEGRPVATAMARIAPDRLAHAEVLRAAPRVVPAMTRPAPSPEGVRGGEARSAEISRDRPEHAATAVHARPEPSRGPGAAARGGAPQSAHSQISAGTQKFGRPEAFRSPAEAAHGGAQQFGRPEVSHGAAQQFGRPEVSRGGAQQFGRPQVFRTPTPSFGGRGVPMPGGGVPHFGGAAAPVHSGGGGSVSHHK
jgi:hypothetical protein